MASTDTHVYQAVPVASPSTPVHPGPQRTTGFPEVAALYEGFETASIHMEEGRHPESGSLLPMSITETQTSGYTRSSTGVELESVLVGTTVCEEELCEELREWI